MVPQLETQYQVRNMAIFRARTNRERKTDGAKAMTLTYQDAMKVWLDQRALRKGILFVRAVEKGREIATLAQAPFFHTKTHLLENIVPLDLKHCNTADITIDIDRAIRWSGEEPSMLLWRDARLQQLLNHAGWKTKYVDLWCNVSAIYGLRGPAGLKHNGHQMRSMQAYHCEKTQTYRNRGTQVGAQFNAKARGKKFNEIGKLEEHRGHPSLVGRFWPLRLEMRCSLDAAIAILKTDVRELKSNLLNYGTIIRKAMANVGKFI